MNIRIDKVDYPPNVGPRDNHGSEFEVTYSDSSCCIRGPITRKQLEKLHQQIGELLATNGKPKYTLNNRSSIGITLQTETYKEDQDR